MKKFTLYSRIVFAQLLVVTMPMVAMEQAQTPEVSSSLPTTDQSHQYHSTYLPKASALSLLCSGKILADHELPHQMMDRVIYTLFSVETKFNTSPAEIKRLECELGSLLDAGDCVMSTPILTNAGRYCEKPLSACTVPLIDLREDMSKIRVVIDRLHQDGMGTGFNLDECEDPVATLRLLNNIAVQGARSGKEDRPVGNIAVLSVGHPKILEFINAKNQVDTLGEQWIFNISVNIDDAFMDAFSRNTTYMLRDGNEVLAQELLGQMAKSVFICGDPGIVFINRLNEGNPTPGVGDYIAVAPCGEVGLAAGESCQFGYINVAKFLNKGQEQSLDIDFERLAQATRLMVRALDNALELSIDKYACEQQGSIMRAKRKIGIGICGLADLFMLCNISYADEQARRLAQDIVAFINYTSKLASHELSMTRGSFEAMALGEGCRYNNDPGFIEQRFGKISTPHVSTAMWHELSQKIRETKCLRNASTIALPPTGRSSMVINASAGIEPQFSLVEARGLNPILEKALTDTGIIDPNLIENIMKLGRIGKLSEIPASIRHIFLTALEISPADHLAMMEALQLVVDESISKTVNVSPTISEPEIVDIFHQTYLRKLKGITIYRDGSRNSQPKKLGDS